MLSLPSSTSMLGQEPRAGSVALIRAGWAGLLLDFTVAAGGWLAGAAPALAGRVSLNPRGPGRWPGCGMEPGEWSAKFTGMWGMLSVGPRVH